MFRHIIDFAFKVSYLSYFAFWILEIYRKGFVSNYINLSILLIIVVILGIGVIIFPRRDFSEQRPGQRNYIFFVLIAILGIVIGSLKSPQANWTIVIWISFFLVSFLGYFKLLNHKDE